MGLKEDLNALSTIKLEVAETIEISKSIKDDIEFLEEEGVSLAEIIRLALVKLPVSKLANEYKPKKGSAKKIDARAE